MALDTRTAAAEVIGEVLAGKSLNQVLTPRLLKVAERDRGLLQQLCYGSLRQAPRLQALLEQLLDKPLRDKDRDVQGLLICGLYQLESTRIPDHAAVAATVGAVRGLKKNWAKNMTNAVLRRFLRERGYRYVHVGSWFGGTKTSRIADENPTLDSATDFDAILSPTCPILPPKEADLVKDEDYARLNMLSLRNTLMINIFDGCSIAIPMSKPEAPPTSLMVSCAPMADRRMLGIAKACETAIGVR